MRSEGLVGMLDGGPGLRVVSRRMVLHSSCANGKWQCDIRVKRTGRLDVEDGEGEDGDYKEKAS